MRDIELADLPKQPQQLEEEKRAREEEGTLAKAKEGASDAVTAALSHLLAARKEQGSAEKPREGGEGEEGPKQGLKKERKELAGISTSLIEKVRARERAAREAREAEERKRAGVPRVCLPCCVLIALALVSSCSSSVSSELSLEVPSCRSTASSYQSLGYHPVALLHLPIALFSIILPLCCIIFLPLF